MTNMKDYVDEVMSGVKKNMNNDDNDPNINEIFEMGMCPFCHSEEIILAIKTTPKGKNFNHFCVHCNKSWLVELDGFSGEMTVSEIDLSDFMPDDVE